MRYVIESDPQTPWEPLVLKQGDRPRLELVDRAEENGAKRHDRDMPVDDRRKRDEKAGDFVDDDPVVVGYARRLAPEPPDEQAR
jgi:hypothetical protein